MVVWSLNASTKAKFSKNHGLNIKRLHRFIRFQQDSGKLNLPLLSVVYIDRMKKYQPLILLSKSNKPYPVKENCITWGFAVY